MRVTFDPCTLATFILAVVALFTGSFAVLAAAVLVSTFTLRIQLGGRR